MKVSLIPPDSLLEMESLGTESFVLANRWAKTEYEKYYLNTEKSTILDNGAYELGASLPAQYLVHIARKMKAKTIYIVVPDVLRNAKATRLLYLGCFEALRRLPWKLMVVPQGEGQEEWMEEYTWYSKRKSIDCIGVPIWLNKAGYKRSEILRMLKTNGMYNTKAEHHLLGLDDPHELVECKGLVTGVDTSLPFSLAWSGIELKDEKPKDHPRVLVDAVFTPEQRALTVRNINTLMRLAQG